MEIRDEINNLVDNLSYEDCASIFREASIKEIEMTKKIMDMGIDPLSPDSPFIPILAGKIYAEEGLEGLEKYDGFNEKRLRECLKFIMEVEARVDDVLDKGQEEKTLGDTEGVMFLRQKLNMAKVKRKTFKVVSDK